MLKINYTSTICTDVLRDLENCMKTDDIDTWLEKQVRTIDFNCYNFPNDEDCCYEHYFECEDVYLAASQIFYVLKKCISKNNHIDVGISIVNKTLDEICILYKL